MVPVSSCHAHRDVAMAVIMDRHCHLVLCINCDQVNGQIHCKIRIAVDFDFDSSCTLHSYNQTAHQGYVQFPPVKFDIPLNCMLHCSGFLPI